MVTGELKPLLICRGEAVLLYLVTDRKGYEKSLETKEVWYRHPTTLRLLSLPGSLGGSISDVGSHYRVEWMADHDPQPPVVDLLAGEPAEMPSEAAGLEFLEQLAAILRQRHRDLPEGSYTTHLFRKGEDKIRKKLGEEAVEVILAQEDDRLIAEAADLIYHLLVLLEVRGLSLAQVIQVLKDRHRGVREV